MAEHAHHCLLSTTPPTSTAGPKWAGWGWGGGQRYSPRMEWALVPAPQGHTHLGQRTGERGNETQTSQTQTGFVSSTELMTTCQAGRVLGPVSCISPLHGWLHPHGLLQVICWKSDRLVAAPPSQPASSPPPTSISWLISVERLLDTKCDAIVFNGFISLTPHSNF